MTTSRTLLRTVLPPVLALGLAALMVHPLDAVAPAAAAPASTASVALADRVPLTGSAAARGSLATAVAPVAFQAQAVVRAGRLRTAVLVNAAEPAGTATVVGSAGCSATATPGVPVWIDCPFSGRAATVNVRVTLSDGRVFADTALPVTRG
jgi:hypothetical protein